MRFLILMLLLLAGTHQALAGPLKPKELQSAQAFLERYRMLSESSEAAFYDLYADEALIFVRIESNAKPLIYRGAQYKRFGRELLESGRAVPDASRFSEITVEREGLRLRLRAKRLSSGRCYWDRSYEVTVKQQGLVNLIDEEHLSFDPSSRCPIANTQALSEGLPARASVSNRPSWHPMSEADVAAVALRLARERLKGSEAEAGANPAPSPPPPRAPFSLWITPPE